MVVWAPNREATAVKLSLAPLEYAREQVARNKRSVIRQDCRDVGLRSQVFYMLTACGAARLSFCLEASLAGLGQPAVHSAQDLGRAAAIFQQSATAQAWSDHGLRYSF